MTRLCCIKGCKQSPITSVGSKRISLHRFPNNNPDVLKTWVVAIIKHNKTELKYRDPHICSEHFKPEDILENGSTRSVKNGAVPCIFPTEDAIKETEGEQLVERKILEVKKNEPFILPRPKNYIKMEQTASTSSVPVLKFVQKHQKVPLIQMIQNEAFQSSKFVSSTPKPAPSATASKLQMALHTPNSLQNVSPSVPINNPSVQNNFLHLKNSSISTLSTGKTCVVNQKLSCGSVMIGGELFRNVTPSPDKNVSLSTASKVKPIGNQQISDDTDLLSLITVLDKPPEGMPSDNIDDDIDLASMVTVLDKPPDVMTVNKSPSWSSVNNPLNIFIKAPPPSMPDVRNPHKLAIEYQKSVMRVASLEINLKNHKEKLLSEKAKGRCLVKKIWRKEQRIKLLEQKIESLKTEPRDITSLEAAKKLSRTLPIHIKQLFQRLVKIEDGYVKTTIPYGAELKDFAIELYSLSPKAYELVRKSFNHVIPDKRAIQKLKKIKLKKEEMKSQECEMKECNVEEAVVAPDAPDHIKIILSDLNEEVIVAYDTEEPMHFEEHPQS